MADSPMPRPWRLDEATYADVQARGYEVAVIPCGATEPHNLHLPYGTDSYEAETIANRLAEAAWAKGAKILVLPTVPFGTETNQRGCLLSINVNPSTLFAFLTDVIESLAGHGIKKVLILNSHGGNDFKPLLREIFGRFGSHVFLCNWYTVLKDVYPEIFRDPGDHAGELETAFILASHPHLVRKKADGSLDADEGAVRSSRFDAVEKGWVGLTRPWPLLTTNTGVGNPHPATAEQGRRVLDLLTERLAPFLVELANSPLDAEFPFAPRAPGP
ncbi:MAG TPA: creatininase family protein [Pirellulales bacterium]